MKRIMLMIMALLMVMSLSANGKSDGAAKADELTELIWYVPGPGKYADKALVYGALNEMLNRDLGVNVTIKESGGFGEYKETMPLAMASGEKFDLVWTSSWCNTFLDAATDGLYAGLDELLPAHAPSIWKDTKDSLEAARVDGEIRGVWSQQIAASTSNVILRESHITKYGWDTSSIKSIRDIEPFLADIKANEQDLIPLSTRKPLPVWLTPYLGYAETGVLNNVIGVRIDDKNVKLFNIIEDPAYIDLIDLSWDWYKKGYIAKDGLTYNNDQWGQLENAGKTAIGMHNTWIPGAEVGNTAYGDKILKIPFGQSYQNTGNIVSTLNAVSAASNNKVEAVKLLEYLWTDKKAFNTLVWGLSGSHYEELDGGFIKPNPNSGYFTNIPWVFGNTFLSYPQEGQDPDSVFLVYELNQKATKASVMGFIPNLENIQTLVASLDTVFNQYNTAVVAGYLDPAIELPKYQAALKQAGIDELITELQKQVDAWLKNK